MTNAAVLKAEKINYLGGDDEWYTGDVDPSLPPEHPITLNGPLSGILKIADRFGFSIVPEAQNMTKYDGSGIATVTLSSERMDVNTAGGGGAPDYEVVKGQVRIINNSATTKSVTFAFIKKDDILWAEEVDSGELAAEGGYAFWGVDNFVSPQNIYIPGTVAGPDCYNIIDNGNGSYDTNGADFFLQAIFPAST